MKTYSDVVTLMQQYMVLGDKEALIAAIEHLNAELSDPSLQPHHITLHNLTGSEAAGMIQEQGFLTVGTQEADADGVIVDRKLVRIFPTDMPVGGGACIVLMVARVTDDDIILVPFGGLPDGSSDT